MTAASAVPQSISDDDYLYACRCRPACLSVCLSIARCLSARQSASQIGANTLSCSLADSVHRPFPLFAAAAAAAAIQRSFRALFINGAVKLHDHRHCALSVRVGDRSRDKTSCIIAGKTNSRASVTSTVGCNQSARPFIVLNCIATTDSRAVQRCDSCCPEISAVRGSTTNITATEPHLGASCVTKVKLYEQNK